MPTPAEKAAFSERLKIALGRSSKKVATGSELALQFNLRHTKESITQQTAHKWLSGQSCPTPDKMETLADWLGVSVHWLRFGPPDEGSRKRGANSRQSKSQQSPPQLSSDENRLVARFRQLTPHQQTLISDLITQLVIEREIWPE